MIEIQTRVLTILWQALCPPSHLISPAPHLENNATLRPDKLVFDLLEAYDTITELDLQILSPGNGVLFGHLFCPCSAGIQTCACLPVLCHSLGLVSTPWSRQFLRHFISDSVQPQGA